MDICRRNNLLLPGFITLSLLLHLLLLWLTPGLQLVPAVVPEPVVVEMRPPQPSRPRELDLPQPVQEQPRTRPAHRLSAADQQVSKETAPSGTMPEDLQPATPTRPSPPVKPAPPRASSTPAQPAPITATPAPPALSRRQLLAAADQAAQNVADQQIAEWRQKLRDDVERGNAVWLDTEKDLLISFFQRFRAGVYNVWNYPAAAAAKGQQGICLLKITINRAGIIEAVQIIDSSGFAELDNTAVEAVKKASSSFGYLPSSYKEEYLNIFAFFHYQLGGVRTMYGAQ